MTPEQLAQIAYGAYLNIQCRYEPGFKFDKWHKLDEATRQSWIAAAQAVKANVMANFTHVGETHA